MPVLGIDAGATKTVCLLGDDQGRILGRGRAAGANLQISGQRQVEQSLNDVIRQALDTHALSIDAICVGMAGADREHDAHLVQGMIRRLGRGAPVVVVNDALIALEAGAPGAAGVVVISGTGSIAYGRNAAGHAARSGGWGHMIGDEGSGYWIGKEALAAVVRDVDGRGPHTRLTQDVLAHFGVRDAAGLVQIVYDRDMPRRQVAALGPVVQQARDAGDPVAVHILEWAADELVLTVRSVAARLGLSDDAFPVVLAGGAFSVVPWLAGELRARLMFEWPHSDVRLLDREPALGAVSIALAVARGDARIPTYR